MSPTDLAAWRVSPAYERITSLILRVNREVRGKRISEGAPGARLVPLLAVLKRLDVLVSETPPAAMEKSRRYGNIAFRTLVERVLKVVPDLMIAAGLPPELGLLYLVPSLGNPTRLDYGTGHELSFIAFLAGVEMVLARTAEPRADEYMAMGLAIFDQYLRLVRRVQAVYSLEPAGSHGVWGLDDYQFVPFLWGSSQLVGQDEIAPAQVLDERVLAKAGSEYLYAEAIEHICTLKKGRYFGEHSPLLYDLTSLPDWERINRGMIRMYQEEVLHKFPVVQHFEFSSWLPMDKDALGRGMDGEKSPT